MFVYNHKSSGLFDGENEYKNERFSNHSSIRGQPAGVKTSTRRQQQRIKLTPCNKKFLESLGFKVKKL